MKIPIVVFLGLVIPGLCSSYSQSPDLSSHAAAQRAEADIQVLSTQLKLYQALNGFPPSTPRGLEALVNYPSSDPQPTLWRRLLQKLPPDPWGHPYLYRMPGVHNPNSFDVYSMGPDGKADTNDDIGNW
jgi:general secretion pathway protein G